MRAFKSHGVCGELMSWLAMGVLALSLAVPVSLWVHRLSVWDFAGQPAAPPPAALQENSLAPPAYGTIQLAASASDHHPALNPEPELLDKLSDQADAALLDEAVRDFDVIIEQEARINQVSPALVRAVIQAESGFNPNAVSNNGAVGLMQVLPHTARAMGINNPKDPEKNIRAGVRYLKSMLVMFNDDERLALAAYNCGPEKMKRFGGDRVPPIKETRAFVDKVMRYYNSQFMLDG